jgi:hypothetical protein
MSHKTFEFYYEKESPFKKGKYYSPGSIKDLYPKKNKNKSSKNIKIKNIYKVLSQL